MGASMCQRMEELRVVALFRRREEGAIHHLMPTLAKDTRLLWVGVKISDADGTLLSALHQATCNAILELKQDAADIARHELEQDSAWTCWGPCIAFAARDVRCGICAAAGAAIGVAAPPPTATVNTAAATSKATARRLVSQAMRASFLAARN